MTQNSEQAGRRLAIAKTILFWLTMAALLVILVALWRDDTRSWDRKLLGLGFSLVLMFVFNILRLAIKNHLAHK